MVLFAKAHVETGHSVLSIPSSGLFQLAENERNLDPGDNWQEDFIVGVHDFGFSRPRLLVAGSGRAGESGGSVFVKRAGGLLLSTFSVGEI